MNRILIADDEMIECRALEMMIRNDFPGEEVLPFASNGLELIALIEREHPDVAVVDINMPGMTGLEALELVHSRNPGMKMIICTAYSDFDYLRQAMQLGASDYLLKPVKHQDFQNTMRKVLGELEKEKEKSEKEASLQRQIGEMNEVLGTEFLSSLLLGVPDMTGFEQYVSSLPQNYHGTVMMLLTGVLEGKESGKKVKLPERQITEEFRKYCRCISRSLREEICVLVFPSRGADQTNAVKWLEDMCQMVSRVFRERNHILLDVGVSSWKLRVEDMTLMLDECKIAARTGEGIGVHFYTRMESEGEEDPLANAFLECRGFLNDGDWKRCISILEGAFDQPETAACGPDRLKAYVMRGVIFLMEGQERPFSTRYQKENGVDWTGLTACRETEQIRTWLLGQVRRSVEIKQDTIRLEEHVMRALLFMEENYEKDISLDQTAGSAGISSFYLSRLLKQEVGKTFVEILTDLRMSRAIVLLQEKKYQVKDIARMTGYPNVTYFYRAFKKYTGMNVGELRRMWETADKAQEGQN